jgi:hypothetical protein
VAGNASPRLTNDTITANTTGDGGAGGSATGGTGGTGTAGGSNGSTGAATNRSGGHGGHGGALSFTALSAVNLTISANATGNGGASGGSGAAAGARGSGGGAYTTTTPAGVYDSIFLDNAPANCPQSLEDYNVDNDGTCGGSGTATLGPLADNGGPTMTQALAPGSFGRDGTGVSDPICMPSDQRGIARPQGDQCDFGAYEVAPPVAVTGSASEISGAGATVAGSVNPNYRVTSYKFEYGTTASYGSSTATQSAGSGNTAAPASVSLTGLMPSTTYHYRLVASSPDGSTNGSDQTFTTSAAPSTGGDGTGTTTGGTGSTGGTPTGPTGNGPGTSTADTTAPLVSRFAIKPKKLKKKTVLKFRLSERARVVIMIKRRGAKKPVRITLQGIAGLNSKTLKRGKLKRGRYTATLVATDAAGNKSAARTIKFRVV